MIKFAVKLSWGFVVASLSFSSPLTSHVLRDGSEVSLQQDLEIQPQKNSTVCVMSSPAASSFPHHGVSLAAGDGLLAFCVAGSSLCFPVSHWLSVLPNIFLLSFLSSSLQESHSVGLGKAWNALERFLWQLFAPP